jgi:hypothetical protein
MRGLGSRNGYLMRRLQRREDKVGDCRLHEKQMMEDSA